MLSCKSLKNYPLGYSSSLLTSESGLSQCSFFLALSLVSHGIHKPTNRYLYLILDERVLLGHREHPDKGDESATPDANKPSSLYHLRRQGWIVLVGWSDGGVRVRRPRY